MKPRRRWLPALLLAASATSSLAANEDTDLDRIPSAVAAPPPASSVPSDFSGSFYIEEAPELLARRSDLAVPFPGSLGPDWVNRVFLDARVRGSLLANLTATYSGRIEEKAEDLPVRGQGRNDFREGFVTWAAGSATFIDVGRINVRDGAGYGFNPTDFFKTGSVVDEVSADPRVLRENRLGTVMVRGQQIFDNGAISALYAPRLEDPPRIDLTNPAGFNGNFDRTNNTDRFLVKGNYDIFPDFSPELLYLNEDGHSSFGANITRGLGDRTTAYLEWAGGDRKNLINEATDYGIRSGTLPRGTPSPLPGGNGQSFQNDLSAGITYATPEKITFTFEYDYHQAGLSANDWRNWFAIGSAPHQSAAVTSALWYLRSYALFQQEPLSRHAIFLRAEWDDAIVRDLTITVLSTINLQDASVLAQATADYRLSDRWTLGFLTETSLGARRSEYGSNPQAALFELLAARHF